MFNAKIKSVLVGSEQSKRPKLKSGLRAVIIFAAYWNSGSSALQCGHPGE